MTTPPRPPKSFTVTRGDTRVTYHTLNGVTVCRRFDPMGWSRVAWFLSSYAAEDYLGAEWADLVQLVADFEARRAVALDARRATGRGSAA